MKRELKLLVGIILVSQCSNVYPFQLIDMLQRVNRQSTEYVLGKSAGKKPAENASPQSNDQWGQGQQNQEKPQFRSHDMMGQRPQQQQPVANPNQVFFKDIIGIDVVLREVTEVVDYLRQPQEYHRLGARMPRGILLEGPPGNGKTMIAKAMATEAQCNFLQVSGSSFVEMYVGVGAQRVRELFSKARGMGRTIIFIDEFDAIAGMDRSALSGGGGDTEYKQTINQLLTELDGFTTNDSTMVIAATNNAASLDSAVKRSGRFDRLIHVPLPNEIARRDLIMHYVHKLPLVDEAVAADIEEIKAKQPGNLSSETKPELKNVKDAEVGKNDDKVPVKHANIFEVIAKQSEGLCAADFKNMANEIAILAVRGRSDAVTLDHVKAGAEKVIMQRKTTKISSDFKSLFKK